VIEGSGVPTRGGVAVRAICHRESRASRRVDGVIRLLPRGQVAARIATIGRRNLQSIIAVDMALAALNRRVFVGERETCRAVVEFSVSPSRDRMARRARRRGGREARRDVIRNIAAERGGLVPVRRVARHAVGRIQCVVAIDVASGASRRRRRHVSSNKSETGRTVIKLAVRPRGDGMARRAGRSR